MKIGLVLAVLACVVAWIFVSSGRDEETPRMASVPAGAESAPRAQSLGLAVPERSGLTESRGALFSAPPARKPAPVVAAPAPPPAAPPLPYRFAGVVRQGGETQVLLARGERVVSVKEGDTLEGGYRVASVTAERVELVYVPLGATQHIAVTSALDANPAPASRAESAGAAPRPAPEKAQAVSSETASLRWEGPEQVRAGSSVSVALKLSYDGPLRATPMQLRFEPGVVEALHVRPGQFLRRGQFSYRVNAEGSIFVGASASGVAPGADAELLVVTFKPVKAGATAGLSMAALSLQGPAGGPVAHARLADYRASILP